MWWTADTDSATAAPASKTSGVPVSPTRSSIYELQPQPAVGDPGHEGKYLTFDTDCGGLNNIRMEFEFAVALARVLGRTLVLPPKKPWYLIDFGQIQVGPRPKDGHASDYGDFWDLDSIRAGGVPVLTMEEFRSRGRPSQEVRWTHDATEEVINWPSVAAVREAKSKGVKVGSRREDRKRIEVSAAQRNADLLHVVVCKKEGGHREDIRNLNQAGHIFEFANPKDEAAHRAFFRAHVHWVPEVFEIASKVVAKLGMFKYGAAHIRRNDLQYKDVFFSPTRLSKRVLPALSPGETLYIATDETSPRYFKPFTENHTVVRWADVAPDAPGSPLAGVKVPPRLIGPVEQVICAGGRVFFGTWRSTFTNHIYRLRNYLHAPDAREHLVSGDIYPQVTEDSLNPASEEDDTPDFWHESPSFSK